MLTGRSVVIAVVVVVIVSLIASTISLLGPNDSEGLGQDTHGTRRHGYRAIFDTMAELGLDVKRTDILKPDSLDQATTVVLWGPHLDLVTSEPAYLHRLAEWVRGGGRVVICPEGDLSRPASLRRALSDLAGKQKSAVVELGLSPIVIKKVDLTVKGSLIVDADRNNQWILEDDDLDTAGHVRNTLKIPQEPTATPTVAADGDLASLATEVKTLEVPEQLRILDLGDNKPAGKIQVTAIPDEPHTIAASFPLGAGEVIVVSEPALFDNLHIAEADNSVLAFYLLAAGDRGVLWDEFYHGLTIRGQPLLLLTRGNYAIFTLLIVAATALWVWRNSIFLGPSLAPAGVTRRTIAEYVEAMARFMHRGPSSSRFVLGEFRDGVLASIRKRLHVTTRDGSAASLAAAIAKQDPAAAQRLLDAVGRVDVLLSQRSRPTDRLTLEALKGLDDCL